MALSALLLIYGALCLVPLPLHLKQTMAVAVGVDHAALLQKVGLGHHLGPQLHDICSPVIDLGNEGEIVILSLIHI